MYRFLLVLRSQNTCSRDFSLTSGIGLAINCLKNDIILVYFPETISLWTNSNNKEVDRYVITFRNLFVFLHNTHYYVAFSLDGDTKLWIIKPLIIRVLRNIRFLAIFIFLRFFEFLCRVWTTSGVTSPLTCYGILRPRRWENLAEVYHTEESAEIIKTHPPVTITLELVV